MQAPKRIHDNFMSILMLIKQRFDSFPDLKQSMILWCLHNTTNTIISCQKPDSTSCFVMNEYMEILESIIYSNPVLAEESFGAEIISESDKFLSEFELFRLSEHINN